MPAFIHAALVAEYAEDCKVSETPWEFWEVQIGGEGEWVPATGPGLFHQAANYRRKPRTIRIGDIDVPEPMRKRPQIGDKFYYIGIAVHCSNWDGDDYDEEKFNQGLIHETSDAANANRRALATLAARRDA